ncbi:MAG: hypothetical protein K0S49_1148 [Microbacterium sp.]|nr:hypothetical protein [Microbacterium sp.]
MLRRLSPLLVAAALALTGCASEVPAASTTSSSSPAAQPSETPTPTPTPAGVIAVGVQGIALTNGDGSKTFSFDDPEPLLAFVEELTGEPRAGEDFEDPWGNGDTWGTLYTWDDITVSVLKDGPASVTILATTVGGIPVGTASGIAIGSTRDDVLAMGGWDEWDADGDGQADYLGVDGQVVEGVESLSRPGEPGREFILVKLDGDVVAELQSPSNDFSDI